MIYETVFDLQGEPFDMGMIVESAVIGVGAVLVLVAMVFRFRQAYRQDAVTLKLVSSTVVVSFAALLFGPLEVLATFSLHSRHRYLQHRMDSGQVDVAEGVVRDFEVLFGGRRERFCVADACFEYSDDDLTGGGFKNMSSRGGPIRPDLHVRVTHVDNTIVRLQIEPGLQ